MPPKKSAVKKGIPKKSTTSMKISVAETAIDDLSSAISLDESLVSETSSVTSVDSEPQRSGVKSHSKRSMAGKRRASTLKKSNAGDKKSTKRRSSRMGIVIKPTTTIVIKKKNRGDISHGAFNVSIKKVSKQINEETGRRMVLTPESVAVLDAFSNHILDRLVNETSNLMRVSEKKIMQDYDIKFAARLLLPPDHSKQAIIAAERALHMTKQSRGGDQTPTNAVSSKSKPTTPEKSEVRPILKRSKK